MPTDPRDLLSCQWIYEADPPELPGVLELYGAADVPALLYRDTTPRRGGEVPSWVPTPCARWLGGARPPGTCGAPSAKAPLVERTPMDPEDLERALASLPDGRHLSVDTLLTLLHDPAPEGPRSDDEARVRRTLEHMVLRSKAPPPPPPTALRRRRSLVTDALWPAEPRLDWPAHPWAYRPGGPVPRRDNPRALPIHAPEFSLSWSDEYRAALLSAGHCTPYNAVPLLRAWFGWRLALLPRWALSVRVFKILADYRDTPVPETHLELADWYPRPSGQPDPWTDCTAYTSKRLLDGFATFPLQRSDDGSRIVLDHNWDDVPLRGPYELPNVRVTWVRQADGEYALRKIRIASRDRSERRDPVDAGVDEDDPEWFDVREVTPADGHAAWQHAQFVARSVSLVAGQTDIHLARTHLLVESIALCLQVHGRGERAGPLTRVRRILQPFVRDVSGINRLGDALVLEGQGLLPRSTGLDEAGVGARLRNQLAQVDWKGFSPRGKEHPVLGWSEYGVGATAFWEGIGRFVAILLPELEPRAQAREIEALGDALRDHAAHPSTPPGQPATPLAGHHWLWPGEHPRPNPGPGHLSLPGTLEEIRQLCRFVIFHATFVHSWVNDRGWVDGGSLRHAAFGLRHLRPPDNWDEPGFLSWWQDALPRLTDCVPQIAVGWVLHNTRWGVIGDPDDPLLLETIDKGDDLDVVQAFNAIMNAPGPGPTESPADQLVLAGLPSLDRWRIRINT